MAAVINTSSLCTKSTQVNAFLLLLCGYAHFAGTQYAFVVPAYAKLLEGF